MAAAEPRNDSGKAYARCEAHLVYRATGADATRVTFAWADHRFNTAPGGEVRYIKGLYTSGDFFTTLGVAPTLGRLFSTADDRPGCGTPGSTFRLTPRRRARPHGFGATS